MKRTSRSPGIPGKFSLGAVAVEFALLFPLFFLLFYALMSYAIAMLILEGLQHAASEGARASIQYRDPLTAGFEGDAEAIVKAKVAESLSWLPDTTIQNIVDNGVSVVVGNVTTPDGATTYSSIKVTVSFPNYADDGPLPPIELPLYGRVPNLPTTLSRSASM